MEIEEKEIEEIESLLDFSFDITEEYINYIIYGSFYDSFKNNTQKTKPYIFNKTDNNNGK